MPVCKTELRVSAPVGGGNLRFLAVKAVSLSIVAASLASAANFSFQGTLTRDDQIQLFTFSIASTSNVTLRTWSYAGGVNAAGTTIANGGFDPILALFNSSGLLINENDDGAGVAADPVTHLTADTLLRSNLSPGTYSVSVMQYDNFAKGPNLSNGFVYSTSPTFTTAFRCSNGRFCDVAGANRTGAWAFDILGVDSASTSTLPPPSAVPEPATISMMVAGLGGVLFFRKRRYASATR
jgi:hypothetical protein